MTAASADGPVAGTESEIEALRNLIIREMAAQRKDFTDKFDQLSNTVADLPRTLADLSRTFDKLERRLETVELDGGMRKEHLRREAGAPPYREPVRPDSETSGEGFSSYPWERKPATPRLS